MRERCANCEIRPAPVKPVVGMIRCNVEKVFVGQIDLRQRLNKIRGVAFITTKLRPDRMSVDCDAQSDSPVSLFGGADRGSTRQGLLAFSRN